MAKISRGTKFDISNFDFEKELQKAMFELDDLVEKMNSDDFCSNKDIDYNNNSLIYYLKNNNQYDDDYYKVYNN